MNTRPEIFTNDSYKAALVEVLGEGVEQNKEWLDIIYKSIKDKYAKGGDFLNKSPRQFIIAYVIFSSECPQFHLSALELLSKTLKKHYNTEVKKFKEDVINALENYNRSEKKKPTNDDMKVGVDVNELIKSYISNITQADKDTGSAEAA